MSTASSTAAGVYYDHDGTAGDFTQGFDTCVTQFTYDDQGRQLSRTLPVGQAETKTYDDLGRVTYELSFEGVVTAYVRDDSDGVLPGESGRLVATHYYSTESAYLTDAADSTLTLSDEQIAYEYDERGRVTKITQTLTTGVRVTDNVYDDRARLTSVTTPEGAINYEYNAVTGRQDRVYTNSTDTEYVYDEMGRLSTVTLVEVNNTDLTASGNEQETKYYYDLVGNLDRVDQPNGVIVDYLYDELNRLDSLTHYAPDATPGDLSDNAKIAEYNYMVRADGRRAAVSETSWQSGSQQTTQIDWLYDNLGRLTQEEYDSHDNSLDFTADYVFDLVGNRLTKSVDQGSEGTLVDEVFTSLYDANDRLLTETKDHATDDALDRHTVYEYGPNTTPTYGGDHTTRTQKTVYQGTTSSGTTLEDHAFGYNLQGRMASAAIDKTGSGGVLSTETYEYDDSGIRVATTLDGVKTRFLIDHRNPTRYAQVLEEIAAATSSVLKSYVLGHDVITQVLANGPTQHLLYDGHGSTRGLVDAIGQPLSTQIYRYDAYGLPLGFDPANALTTLLYSGEQTSSLTGLQYLRARYYDLGTGRFNRLDPFAGKMQDPQSLHKYIYSHGDGINYADPSGRFEGLVGLLTAVNIQTIISQLDIEALRGVVASLGVNFAFTPGDLLFGKVIELAISLVPDWVKQEVADYLADLCYADAGIVLGVVAVVGVTLSAALGVHQHRQALAMTQRKLASQVDLIGRTARIAGFPEPARTGATMAYKEALGLARLETYTGRMLRPATDAASDATDSLLGRIQLKGPIVNPVTRRLIVNDETIEGLFNSVVKSAKYHGGYDTLVVDLLGFSDAQIGQFMKRLEEEALSKTVQVIY